MNQWTAAVERAKLLNGEASDMQATERSVMFSIAALLAMGEDEAFVGQPIVAPLAQALAIRMNKERFVELAAKYKLCAEVIQSKIHDTAFELCKTLDRES